MGQENHRDYRVVHVSGDFPDPIEPFKTPVVQTLLKLTESRFRHEVFSINRKSPSVGAFARSVFHNPLRPSLAIHALPIERGTALSYIAPPRGIYHATMLDQLGDWLAERLLNGSRPDLLVGHKLAFEGIAVARAAQRLNIPFAISIQGDSDTKVLSARPDLATRLRQIFHKASVVFPFAPWSLAAVERRLGKRQGPTLMLPCPTDLDEPRTPVAGGQGLVTTFHLKNHRRKNLKAMADALKLIQAQGAAPELTVIGGGNAEELSACKALTASVGSVRFAGAMDRAGVRDAFAKARGFVMPSLRESFGLVFIEALFAGLPIAYPAGTAVDGYFDGLPFALRVDARDPVSVAGAMQELNEREAELKARLSDWLRSDGARRFTRAEIAQQFGDGLAGAIQGRD